MKPNQERNENKTTKFKFDRSVIRNVARDEGADDLNYLNGVDVFDQNDFEQGVIQQANDAFIQNCERQKSLIEKEITSIDEDIKQCENELTSIGELLETLDCSDISSSELRQRIVAIKSQEKNKTNQLTTLHNRKFSLQQKLNRLTERSINVQASDLFGFNTTETDEARRIRLGEMTPFEARNHRETPSTSTNQSSAIQNGMPKLSNRGRIKSMKRSIKFFKDNSQPKDGDESDEDYEDMRSDASFDTDEELGVPMKSKKGKKLKRKTKVGHRHASLEDDWCEEVYKNRIKDFQEPVKNNEEKDEVFEGGLKIPGRIWNKLFPYQKTGVRWFWELHTQDVGGILGDEMGLGKTLQIIALLAALGYSKLEDRSMLPKYHGLGPVLIMCPTTVMHQWLKEFRLWWPEFKVIIVHSNGGSSSLKTKHLLASIFSANHNHRKSSRPESHPIVISSYNTVHRYSNEFLSYPWHYLILDEGHKIRNPDAQITLICKQFRTCHRIIMSGSPVQNNLKELWSLFDFIFPGKLGTLPDFMTHFNVPIAQGQYATSTDVQVQTAYRCAETLRDIIVPYLLRRMKSDVQSSVSLPEKNEQVLFCRLTDYQRKVYREFLDSKEYKSIVEGRITAFSGLITVRKICNHPDICTGAPKDFWRDEDRGHHQHRDNPQGEDYGYWKRSGKMIVVEALLAMWKKQGHKVLLFTQSRQMLEVMELFVRDREYRYFRMDGATNIQTRQPLVMEFNSNPNIFLFLLTTRVGGLGINLTGASRVIIYDPDWNPSTDIQARERAWRIGQRSDVTVYRLVTTGTVEEKIYQRQIFKQFLTNRILSDPRQRRFFDSSDLRELFTLGGDEGNTETSAIFAGTGSEVKLSSLKKKSKRNKRSRYSDDEEEGEHQSKKFKHAEGRAKNGKKFKSAICERVNRFDLFRENPLTNRNNNNFKVKNSAIHGNRIKAKKEQLLCCNVKNLSSSSSSPTLFTGDVRDSTNETKSFEVEGGDNAVKLINHISKDSLGNHLNQSQETIQENFEESQSNCDDNLNVGNNTSNSKQPPTTNETRDGHDDRPIANQSDAPKQSITKDFDINDHLDTDHINGPDDINHEGGGDDDEVDEKLITENINDKKLIEGNSNDNEDCDDDDDKVSKWKLLAKALSQKIGGMTFSKDLTLNSDGKDGVNKKKKHKERDGRRKRMKNAQLDGSEINNLDRVGEFKVDGDDDDAKKKRSSDDDDDDDNYVLRKLFKKSGIHSAMHHDRIVSSSDPDYRLVEMEAERVARDAERALRASRERCRRGGVGGEPTWTGTNGSAGAPRFGPKKVVKPVEKKKEEVVDDEPMDKGCFSFSASIIPCIIPTPVRLKPKKLTPTSTSTTIVENHKTSTKPQKRQFNGSALVSDLKSSDQLEIVEIRHDFSQEHNESKEKSVSSKDLLSMLRSKNLPSATATVESSTTSPQRPEEVVNEDLELLEDVRAFISVGGEEGPGIVTSEELVNHFKGIVSTERSAVFREMTRQICNFYKNNGVGTFSLKPEHRRVD